MAENLLSYNHINTICNFMLKKPYVPDYYIPDIEVRGRILWAENYRSNNYKFNKNDIEPFFQFKYEGEGASVENMSVTEFIKLVKAAEHSCSQHPNYKNSEAHRIIEEINVYTMARIQRETPGVTLYKITKSEAWEKAPWFI